MSYIHIFFVRSFITAFSSDNRLNLHKTYMHGNRRFDVWLLYYNWLRLLTRLKRYYQPRNILMAGVQPMFRFQDNIVIIISIIIVCQSNANFHRGFPMKKMNITKVPNLYTLSENSIIVKKLQGFKRQEIYIFKIVLCFTIILCASLKLFLDKLQRDGTEAQQCHFVLGRQESIDFTKKKKKNTFFRR